MSNREVHYIYICIQASPSECVRREIPGVTQVKKGHEGTSAVVTAYSEYIYCRKHGTYLSLGINSD